MADENISIEIADKVSPSISTKLNRIATEARSADAAVKNLQTQLAAINVGGLSQLINASANATRQLQAGAVAAQRLATEQQRTATAAAQAAAAQQRVTTAATQSQTAAQNLAAATTRANTAQTQGQTAAQRLATEQARTAAQTANAAAASDRAALAALRLQQAQDRAAQSSQRAASSIMSFVRGAAALVGVGLSAQAILQSADAYTVLQNKLQNVSDSERQVTELTNELFNVANKTRTPVQETAQVFTRFDMALKNLGKSQQDSLRLTETVNKMLVVSGATSTEASSALLQLSQAFNKGKLDGDEFRSVMELMPNAADAIAKRLGVTRGELLKLAPQGKITAQVMVDAFNDAAKGIDEKFGKTVPTLSQAMTVLKNNATQTFGEINKQLGITSGISKVIIFLAENMKALAVAAAIAGAALLVAFGPTLVAAISSAASAVWAFTAALAANPIGLLVVGITAAIAAITVFGDEIAVTADKSVTLKDMFRTAFAYISDAAGVAAEWIKSVWNTAIDWVNSKTEGWGEQFRDVGNVIVKLAKGYVNFVIASWVGAFNAIKVIWDKFPDVMQYVFASVVNFGASAVETVVNAWQIGLRKIAELGAEVAPDMAGRLNAALDAATIKLPRMQVGDAAKGAAAEVGKAFTDAFNKDYVGDAANAFMARARDIAAKRKAAEGQGSALRGTGPNLTPNPIDEKAAKAAEKRATALAKINAELDNELSRMYMLKPEREAQARFDQIEEQLLGKKIKLSQDEAAAIKEKIKAIQEAKDIQQAYDRIYEEAVGPQRDYNASLTAAQKLLQQGSITQEQYSRAVLRSSEAYANSKDPMRQYNKQLDEQLTLLKLLPKQREIEQQVMQISNDLLEKGISLSEEENEALRNKLALIQGQTKEADKQQKIYEMIASMPGGVEYDQELENLKMFKSELMDIWDTAVKPLQQVEFQLMALNDAFANGGVTADYYKQKIVEFTIETSKLLNLLGYGNSDSFWMQAFEGIMSGFVNLAYNTSSLLSDTFSSFSDGLSDALARSIVYGESLGDALKNVARQVISELISGLIKLGIQYVINAAIANSSMAANVAASAAAASATAAAWSPAAAMASLATMGGNGTAAQAAVASTVGLTKALSVSGFKEGGYTGSIGVNEVAGVVHGREYVMDANATARIGVANLQALQAGAANVQRNGEQAGAASVGSAPAAAPAPIVNVPFNAVVVQSKEAALAGLKSAEGKAFIIETIEQNGGTVAKIVGVK